MSEVNNPNLDLLYKALINHPVRVLTSILLVQVLVQATGSYMGVNKLSSIGVGLIAGSLFSYINITQQNPHKEDIADKIQNHIPFSNS